MKTCTSSSVALASYGTITVLLAPERVTLKVPATSIEVLSALRVRLHLDEQEYW